ncbi:MAG: aldo/keto reductase [Phycisphaerales bacterium]
MQYRMLGRTGLKVSQLGFGAMRLPMVGEGDGARVNRELAVPMIHRAFELGVNYIDTAVMYCNNDSQRAVGEAVNAWIGQAGRKRSDLVVSTKNHYYEADESAWWKNLTDSLERLGLDYLDIYNTHGVNWAKYTGAVEPRIYKWLTKAKDQGLIRHICTSFHDDADALKKLVDTDRYESFTIQYNMLDRQLEEAMAYAHEKGKGIVVMGPVAGGRLGVQSDVLTKMVKGVEHVSELALRFVLSNANVTVALSGMGTMAMVEENAAIAADAVSLNDEQRRAIDSHLTRLKSMADLYCTGCQYCMPCDVKVNVAGIFANYNLGRVYGLWDVARSRYADIMRNNQGADNCVQCYHCLEKCPQHLDIPRQLAEAHAAMRA